MSTLAYIGSLAIAFLLGAWAWAPMFEAANNRLNEREKELDEHQRKLNEAVARFNVLLTKKLHGTG